MTDHRLDMSIDAAGSDDPREEAMPNGMITLQSAITCRACGRSVTETMPTDASQQLHECQN